MYKRRRSHDFLARFTELNYRLKYVEGNGVMTFAKNPATAKHAVSNAAKSVERADAKQAVKDVPLAVPAPGTGRPLRKRGTPARSSSPP